MADLFRQKVFEKLADKLADLAINDPQMRSFLIVMIMNEMQQSKEIRWDKVSTAW